jgi:hypothetical protein
VSVGAGVSAGGAGVAGAVITLQARLREKSRMADERPLVLSAFIIILQ